MKNKKVVVIGGGTGTFVVLSGLKDKVSNLSAIVSMADSGGSNRIIRDEFGLLPTSDIRQCFVALASGTTETQKIMRNLFTYRFDKGIGISGMTFGNLFMAALADILGSQYEAIKKTGEVLRISGKIIPVTLDDIHLMAKYEDGEIVKGEHFIDEPPQRHDCTKHIIELWTEPEGRANKSVLTEIKSADLIILGPGDLYTSILANIVIKKIANAIKKSKAKVVYVVNLMTRMGQTYNFKASNHITEIKKYLGKLPDIILLNKALIPHNISKRYLKEERSVPVEDDLKGPLAFKVIKRNFISNKIYQKAKSDLLKRSLIRHDSEKLARTIIALL